MRDSPSEQRNLFASGQLGEAANRLSALDLLILNRTIGRPVSFYEIVRVHPGQGAVLRDRLISETAQKNAACFFKGSFG